MSTMASSEGPTSLGDFHCLECGNHVEIVHGDKKLSIRLHKLQHVNLGSKSEEFDQSSCELFGKTKSSSSSPIAQYTCQVCNEQVEILYNDVKLSFKIHSKKRNCQLEPPSDDQLSNCSSNTSKISAKNTNKVKKKQRNVDSTIIDDAFITLAPCFRSHRGFILKNLDGMIFCNVCKVDVDIFSISDHLSTEEHGNNIILLLKNFIPYDLHSSLDCLVFNNCNLACSLCNCNIDLCSSNPHETIVNIFAHNAQNAHNAHLSKKSANIANCKTDDPQYILQSLSEISSVISENNIYLDIVIQRQFYCKLCSLCIDYNSDDTVNTISKELLNRLNSHFSGKDHANNRNAQLVLSLFETSNMVSKKKHMLIVSKGCIYCKACFSNIPSETKLIEEHIKTCAAMSINKNDLFFKQLEEILIKIPSLGRTQGTVTKKHTDGELKFLQGLSKNLPFENMQGIKVVTAKVLDEKVKNSSDVATKNRIDIKQLLSTMPTQFRNVTYIVEEDDGKAVKCLVCNCSIPPLHYNVETHLTGKKHQTNEDKINYENISNRLAAVSLNPNLNNFDIPFTVDQVFKYLTRNDPVIKANEKLLMDCGDGLHYFCRACCSLIPTSKDANTFKSSIYQHIQLEIHMNQLPNQKHLIETKGTPKDPCIQAIDELFLALPKYLQGDRQFIKPHFNKTNALYCSLCKVQVSNHVSNLQEHLKGGYHTDLFNELSGPQGFLSKAVGGVVNALQNAVFQNIKKSYKVIEGNEKYLFMKGENYLCGLCAATIQNCTDVNDLTERFLSHLEGKQHITNIIKKLMQSNSDVRDELSCVKVKNQTVYCTKCNIHLPAAFDESSLKRHVFAHFSGKRHKNSISSSQNPPSSQTKHVIIPTPPNHSAMFDLPTVSNNPVISSSQFKGISTSDATTVPRPLINNTALATDPVFEAFHNLPADLQVDKKFIKTCATVPDFLSCTLCSKSIDPLYLKNHLCEENHLREKTIFEERVAYWKMRVM